MGSFESEQKARRTPAMKADRIKGRPPVVHRAVVQGDRESLSFYGKKGAEATNKKKASRKASAEEADAYFRQRQIARADTAAERELEVTREHIVPLDPEDRKQEETS
ncbi:hypothetical protein HY970_04015 [Candidatus Kaiserbacteria bacterium]|nr:hypothetical protein [Candidatus Kaiserbacteria bacterium]